MVGCCAQGRTPTRSCFAVSVCSWLRACLLPELQASTRLLSQVHRFAASESMPVFCAVVQ